MPRREQKMANPSATDTTHRVARKGRIALSNMFVGSAREIITLECTIAEHEMTSYHLCPAPQLWIQRVGRTRIVVTHLREILRQEPFRQHRLFLRLQPRVYLGRFWGNQSLQLRPRSGTVLYHLRQTVCRPGSPLVITTATLRGREGEWGRGLRRQLHRAPRRLVGRNLVPVQAHLPIPVFLPRQGQHPQHRHLLPRSRFVPSPAKRT